MAQQNNPNAPTAAQLRARETAQQMADKPTSDRQRAGEIAAAEAAAASKLL